MMTLNVKEFPFPAHSHVEILKGFVCGKLFKCVKEKAEDLHQISGIFVKKIQKENHKSRFLKGDSDLLINLDQIIAL